MLRKKEWYVIWPNYLDKRKSRRLGRKVSLKLAIIDPTAEEIAEAARRLGLKAIIEKDKAYPREWWIKARVLVERKGNKTELLKKISMKIRELRARK